MTAISPSAASWLRIACLIMRLWRGMGIPSSFSSFGKFFSGFHSISLVLASSWTPTQCKKAQGSNTWNTIFYCQNRRSIAKVLFTMNRHTTFVLILRISDGRPSFSCKREHATGISHHTHTRQGAINLSRTNCVWKVYGYTTKTS